MRKNPGTLYVYLKEIPFLKEKRKKRDAINLYTTISIALQDRLSSIVYYTYD